MAQVWGCRSLGTTRVRAPPFCLSGGLSLLQGPEGAGRGPPRRGPPLGSGCPGRQGEGGALLPRCGSSGAAGARTVSPGHLRAAGRGARGCSLSPGCAAGPGLAAVPPIPRHVPRAGGRAAPPGSRPGRCGWVSVCGGGRCWTPQALHARRQMDTPRRLTIRRGPLPGPGLLRRCEPRRRASVRGNGAGCGALLPPVTDPVKRLPGTGAELEVAAA